MDLWTLIPFAVLMLGMVGLLVTVIRFRHEVGLSLNRDVHLSVADSLVKTRVERLALEDEVHAVAMRLEVCRDREDALQRRLDYDDQEGHD